MAEKKKEPLEDRDFWYKLRNEQRNLVMGELKKEQLEVGRRIQEEQKKFEEAKEALETARVKRRFKKLLIIVLVILFILLIYYLYKQGYLKL
jgi:cytochrome c-type biogenesis protein CcmH/NrfG